MALGAALVQTIYTRRQRVVMALLIVAGFAAWMSIGYLTGPSPEPKNCLSACATSRQVLATEEAGPAAFRSNP